MSVEFIVGRSGTGKTQYCLEQITRELLESQSGQALIFIVPEQATYQAERAILTGGSVKGYSRLHILSFNRLCFWITQKESVLEHLSPLGRELIVSNIIHRRQGELKVFADSADSSGLAIKISDMIVELQKYEKSPDDLMRFVHEAGSKGADEIMLAKFSEVAMIYADYLDFIKDRFVNPDVILNTAREIVAQSELIRGAKVWVDGFSSFNAQERELLIEIIKSAQQTRIALCLDAKSDRFSLSEPAEKMLDDTSMFSPTESVYCQLYEIVKKCKIKIDTPVILKQNHRHKKNFDLMHLEKNIFRDEPEISASSEGAVRIVWAKNLRSEVEYVAGEICRLVRREGYRYRDICVIASDIKSYETYIRCVFGEYGLPYFIDQRKSMRNHPLIELIVCAAKCITDGFSLSDVLGYLKSGLTGVRENEIEKLENYCIANGVKNEDWISDDCWDLSGNDRERLEIDGIRRKAVCELMGLRNDLCGDDGTDCLIGAGEFVGIWFDFLDRLDIRGKLCEWVSQSNQSGDIQMADEHRQFYDQLINLMDEICAVFGCESMRISELCRIVANALGEMTLAFVPPSQDQILVGSIERSRLPEVKAAFLIGSTQKQFPVPAGSRGILSDDDRIFARAIDFELAQGLSQRLIARQYLAYISLTRARDRVYITYPRENEKGAQIQRSAFIDHAVSLFDPALKEEPALKSQMSMDCCVNKMQLCDLLCGCLGRDSDSTENVDLSEAIMSELANDDEFSGCHSIVDACMNYKNKAKLEADVIQQFYGKTLHCSVSRLSKYASCAYKHFCEYVLKIKRRSQFKLEPVDIGNFYHHVLDKMTCKLKLINSDYASQTQDSLRKLLYESIGEYIEQDDFIRNFRKHSRHNAFVIDSACETLEQCVDAISRMSRAGDFKVYGSEIAFGKPEDKLGECVISGKTGNKLFLRGVIDRVDLARIDGQLVGMVYDYKTNGKFFKYSDVYNGLDMQLLVYMLAIDAKELDGEKVTAGGGFYLPIELKMKKTQLDKIDAVQNAYRAEGFFNGEYAFNLDRDVESSSNYYKFRVSSKKAQYSYYDKGSVLRPSDFAILLDFAREKIINVAGELISGNIEVRPYRMGQKSPCSLCEFQSLCRFDWQINEYNFMETCSKTAMLEKLGGGERE